jgi:hypothetical protein
VVTHICISTLRATQKNTWLESFYYPEVHSFIPIYIQQDATLHRLFYPETALYVSGGTTTHHQEHKQLYLQHLVFVTSLLLSATIVKELEPV